MRKRQRKNTLPESKDQRIAELEEQLAQALATIQELQKLQKEVERLQAEVEELKRAGKRQAAPFARRKLVEHPKKSGRKAGKGRFVRREKPSLKQVTETKVAKLQGCPDCGGKLCEIHTHEQYVTDIPEVPQGNVTLEMGDGIRVVGEKSAVEAFVARAQGSPRRASETSMTAYLVGLLVGVLIGLIPVPFGQGVTLKLGMAGGVFLTSLLIGHFGRVGPFRLYVPPAAKNLTRELGLMLFLAGAGTNAGAQLVNVLKNEGWILVLAGAGITLLSALAGLAVMIKVYKLNLLSAMGSLTAAMTNPPALASANSQTETDLPSIAYASTYPVALIFKILLAQALVEILSRLL